MESLRLYLPSRHYVLGRHKPKDLGFFCVTVVASLRTRPNQNENEFSAPNCNTPTTRYLT